MSENEPEIHVVHRKHESGYSETHRVFPGPPGDPWYKRYWKWIVAAFFVLVGVATWIVANYSNLKEIQKDLIPKTESKTK
jgi:hypothetical protein